MFITTAKIYKPPADLCFFDLSVNENLSIYLSDVHVHSYLNCAGSHSCSLLITVDCRLETVLMVRCTLSFSKYFRGLAIHGRLQYTDVWLNVCKWLHGFWRSYLVRWGCFIALGTNRKESSRTGSVSMPNHLKPLFSGKIKTWTRQSGANKAHVLCYPGIGMAGLWH